MWPPQRTGIRMSAGLWTQPETPRSDSTRRNYCAAWCRLSMWAEHEGLSAIPVVPERAAAYIRVNGPAKLPPFGTVFPLFEHDRPDHGLTARTADRAVLL